MATHNLIDQPLIDALDCIHARAKANVDHYDAQVRMGAWLGQPPTPWQELIELVQPVLVAHPELGNVQGFAFGPKQVAVFPTSLVHSALGYCGHHGGAATVAWLRRVVSHPGPTTVRYVAEVYGLKLDSKVKLSNGVTLVSLDDLPASDNAEAIKAQFHIRPGPNNFRMEQAVGAYIEQSGIPRSARPEGDNRSLVLETTIRAFTLVANMAPVVGTTWAEHTDPDLFAAEFGRVFNSGWMEGRLPTFGETVDADAIQWVEAYLALAPDVRKSLDLAISRLNLGRRRLYPGDQAIEAGICLETLLGDVNEKTDMTYKLRLRTARLLEKDFAARKTVLGAVNKLYALRSLTVHGGTHKDDRKARAVATEGLEIAAGVLRATVKNGGKFDSIKLDLED